MKRVRSSAPTLADLVPYDPRYLPARIHLNANENPYGLPEAVVESLGAAVRDQLFHRYPDPLAKGLRARIAEQNGVDEGMVLLGNGGDELLLDIMLAWGGPGRKLLTAPPSFSSYDLDAKLTGTLIVEVPRVERAVDGADAGAVGEGAAESGKGVASKGVAAGKRELGIDEEAVLARVARGDIDVVMLASPNNPTGDVLREDFVLALLDASDALILIDEAYIEYASGRLDMISHLKNHENLVLLRTFSKAWALAGIRLGYLLASPRVVSELCKVRQPYSVDAFSVLAGQAVLDCAGEIQARVAESVSQRACLATELGALPGVVPFVSHANFILFRVPDAHGVWERLYEGWGILLRDFSAARGLKDCLRVSVGTPRENEEFLDALRTLLEK
jgi:histidinol-phosphate aminotransferase